MWVSSLVVPLDRYPQGSNTMNHPCHGDFEVALICRVPAWGVQDTSGERKKGTTISCRSECLSMCKPRPRRLNAPAFGALLVGREQLARMLPSQVHRYFTTMATGMR